MCLWGAIQSPALPSPHPVHSFPHPHGDLQGVISGRGARSGSSSDDGDADSEHLLKEMSASCLHCLITTFLFISENYLMGIYLEMK